LQEAQTFLFWALFHTGEDIIFKENIYKSSFTFFKRPLGPACHIICRGGAFRSIIEEENFFGGFIL
jgi:hypothetical protein